MAEGGNSVNSGDAYRTKLEDQTCVESEIPPGDDDAPTGEKADGPFSHPVYKQVSLANGLVNKMRKDEIRRKLAELKMSTKGHKDVLKKRLKNYYKDRQLVQARVRKRREPSYDYYIVIDFEATCDQYNPDGFRHEIIEFPVVLIDAHTVTVTDEFHKYVKPTVNPKLTTFCTNLTGIKQCQVDEAEPFDIVLAKMEAWMKSHCLGSGKKFAVVTDGPWDMSRFMFLQCQLSSIVFPKWAKRWINIRKAYCNFYRFRRAKLLTMLENLGMTFEGHPHSGLDDTRNIARINMQMLLDGAELRVNEELFQDKREKNAVHAVVCPLKKNDLQDEEATESRRAERTEQISNESDPRRSSSGPSSICDNCALQKRHWNARIPAGNNSRTPAATAQLSGLIGDMNIADNKSGWCRCGQDESDNVEDLLSYWALQKA